MSGGEGLIKEDLMRVEEDERRLAEDVGRLEHDLNETEREISVEVNGTRVVFSNHRVTGLEIKRAAIEQGATLEIDFQLWRLEGQHKRVQIADNEEAELHEGERFAATTPDDNS